MFHSSINNTSHVFTSSGSLKENITIPTPVIPTSEKFYNLTLKGEQHTNTSSARAKLYPVPPVFLISLPLLCIQSLSGGG